VRRATLIALFCLVSAACAETRLYSGQPPGDIAPGFDAHWHSAYLLGMVEGGPPYELDRICPRGWAEVHVAPDFFTNVIALATLFVYTPNRVTVICAETEQGKR